MKTYVLVIILNLLIYSRENKKLLLNDRTYKIFFNSVGNRGKINREAKNILKFIANNTTEDDFTEKLAQEVQKIKENKKWQVEYMTLLMREREKYAEGLAEGLAKGEAKGLAEGLAKGEAKGLVKGAAEGEIIGAVNACKNFNLSFQETVQYLIDNLNLSLQEAEENVEKNWI